MKYEENKSWSKFKSWMFVLFLSASLLIWAMVMMTMVKDVPREWEFGTIEFTPGKSEYSTHNPGKKTLKNQIAPLPDGVSMEEEKQINNRKR